MKMTKVVCVLVALLGSCFNLIAQDFLGTDEFPTPITHISPAPYFGEDFDGGYQVGEMVSNFQIYDPEGGSLRLSDVFENGKYTILTTGSATCNRFTSTWNLDEIGNSYSISRHYIFDHISDFNWVFFYGYEAHPGDVENCTSNCPANVVPAPNGDTLYSHQLYSDRIAAIHLWRNIIEDPEYNYEFPFNMYADNPENEVYNTFLQRPFGSVILDCEGSVLETVPWLHFWLGSGEGVVFLDNLISPQTTCETGAYYCTEEMTDTDGDGICDDQELWQGWDPNDPDDPYVFTSIMDSELAELSVFPNPFNGLLTLSKGTTGDQIRIWDMQGRLVYTTRLQSFSTIDLSVLEQGVYTLTLIEKSGEMSSQLIVRS